VKRLGEIVRHTISSKNLRAEDSMRSPVAVALLLLSPVLARPAFAQNDAAKARMAAGCGADEVKFNVKTDKKHHPMGQPETGKALVYVFGDSDIDNEAHIGSLTTRIGIDGVWVGANKMKSYLFFQSDPGEHRVCTSVQGFASGRNDSSSAVTFTAEPGKVYYFRTKTPAHATSSKQLTLVPVDPAAAQLLIAETPFSTFQLKK
jgi:hypothetical protein